MSIEFKIQSIMIQPEDIQEQFPGLISMMNSYLPKKKKYKRRKRKAKETVGSLIEDIIDSIGK